MDIDPEIITKAINKDLIAFEQVVFTFEKPIFNYLFRLLGNKPDAEDAVQDTFIKVYKNLKTYQPEKKFSTWVFAIAINTAYDSLRKRKYVIETDITEAINLKDETKIGEDPYYTAEREVNAQMVQKHLNQLKPVQKNLILLYYYKEFSLQEIADLLNMPLGTVKTNLFRAREELKKLIM
jgi:RNA polymerase sigma-70 factor (ECF subfamily)